MVIAVIRGVTVFQDNNNVISWESGASIDADGANGQNGNPFAYRYPNDDGLDKLQNAGWPWYNWRNSLLDNGSAVPLTDEEGNAYSSTSYVWPDRTVTYRYLDATFIPYVVVNPAVRRNSYGIVLGSAATVTYQGHSVSAVVGDVSGSHDIGEVSIACANALGIPSSPRVGGVDNGVTFQIFAGQAAVIGDITYLLQRLNTM